MTELILIRSGGYLDGDPMLRFLILVASPLVPIRVLQILALVTKIELAMCFRDYDSGSEIWI